MLWRLNLRICLATFTITCLPLIAEAQVGIGTENINNGVMLQIDSPDKGILIPRIGLTSDTDTSTIEGQLTNGTLIYNVTDNVSLDEGFYYWNTDKWVAITPQETANIYNSSGTLGSDRVVTAGNKTLQLEGTAGRGALTISRTDDEVEQGIAFRNAGGYYDAGIFMEKQSIGGGLVFASGANRPDVNEVLPTMTLNEDRSISFNDYGSGTHSGSAVNVLGVDANGNVTEQPATDYKENIYTANGTLTGERVISTNDHLITFRNSANRDFSIIPADPSNINTPFIFRTQNAFTFQVDSYDALAIDSQSHIKFGYYGQGIVTGTATYQLGVNATGNVIEVPLPQNNAGTQYYSYNLADFTTPPDITRVRTSETADAFGRYSNALSSSSGAITTMKPSQNDYYIIKVTGHYFVKNSGNFSFSSTSDDGSRIYVDGSLILDSWIVGGGNTGTGTVNLARGKHKFEFWYFEYNGPEAYSFSWGANPDSRSGVINTSLFTID